MDSNTFLLAFIKQSGNNNKLCFEFIKEHGYNVEMCINALNQAFTDGEQEEFKANIIAATNELSKAALKGVSFSSIFDDDYSPLLYNCENPILFFYYLGNKSLINMQCLTVLGTENGSQELMDNCKLLGKKIQENDIILVSDLSLGLNCITMNAYLQNGGKAIAILTNDILSVQPSENRELIKKIIDNEGLIIALYPCGYPYAFENRARKYEALSAISKALLITRATELNEIYTCIKEAKANKKFVAALKGNEFCEQDFIFDMGNNEAVMQFFTKICGFLGRIEDEQMRLF